MDMAGIVPEEDMQDEEQEPGEEVESSPERLSVFEDFLEGLGLENKEEDKEDDEDAEQE
jgi:hypothetical protein